MIICPVLMVEQRKMMFLMKMKQRSGQRMKNRPTGNFDTLLHPADFREFFL